MGKKTFEIRYNSKLCLQGCILAALGILGPRLIAEHRLGIYENLITVMMEESGGTLILAALKLVCMNVVRMIPHYLGAFLINDSVHIYLFGKRRFAVNVVFSVSLIAMIYDLIYQIYGIQYDLGFPAFLTISFVLILSYMNLFSVSMPNKLLLVGSLLMSIQWLDVMPLLSDYGFGRGEISMDIKKAAEFISEEYLLSLFACCMCIAFFFASMMQVQLLYNEHKLKISNEKTRKMEKELYDTQIEALKMRNSSEVQSLVHDLKSPLTTVQGLVTLAEMMEQNDLIKEYFQKISSSLSNMNMMISEILHEYTRSEMSTEELMRMVLAQVSIYIPNEILVYENECPDAVIRGNRIRLSRAVINLINNAYHAVDKEEGKLSLKVERKEAWILITVLDNGTGIKAEEMEHIWELGYSGKQSTGLGLAFTKQVVEGHEGRIEIESVEGEYTRAVIFLKEERNEYGKCKNNSGD